MLLADSACVSAGPGNQTVPRQFASFSMVGTRQYSCYRPCTVFRPGNSGTDVFPYTASDRPTCLSGTEPHRLSIVLACPPLRGMEGLKTAMSEIYPCPVLQSMNPDFSAVALRKTLLQSPWRPANEPTVTMPFQAHASARSWPPLFNPIRIEIHAPHGAIAIHGNRNFSLARSIRFDPKGGQIIASCREFLDSVVVEVGNKQVAFRADLNGRDCCKPALERTKNIESECNRSFQDVLPPR